MAVLRFGSDEIRQACSDLARMRRLWGPSVARHVSRRLQQLEAATTLADLSFLPFDSYEHDDGVFEVAVTDRLALFVERGTDSPEGEVLMDTIVITGLRDRRTMARTS